jgi:hypothetical protein
MRAQGRPGADRTHGPRATRKHAAEPQVRAEQPAFPARVALRLIRTLPGDRRSCPRPRDAKHHRVATTLARCAGLSTGRPGPHDFTVRHRASRPRLATHLTRQRPSHSLSNVRDDAYAPDPDRNARSIRLILRFSEVIYFSKGVLTVREALKGLTKFAFPRSPPLLFRREKTLILAAAGSKDAAKRRQPKLFAHVRQPCLQAEE